MTLLLTRVLRDCQLALGSQASRESLGTLERTSSHLSLASGAVWPKQDLLNCGSGILVPSSSEATAEDSHLTHSALGPVLFDDDNIVWACLETVQEEDVLIEAEAAEDRFHQRPEGPFVEVVASRNHLDLVHLIIRQENLHEGRPNAVDTRVGDFFLLMRDMLVLRWGHDVLGKPILLRSGGADVASGEALHGVVRPSEVISSSRSASAKDACWDSLWLARCLPAAIPRSLLTPACDVLSPGGVGAIAGVFGSGISKSVGGRLHVICLVADLPDHWQGLNLG